MRDKLLQIRADKDFCEKVDYLRRINGYNSNSETVRKIIEKEYRKETQNQEQAEAIDDIKGKGEMNIIIDIENNEVHLCKSCVNCFPECEAQEGIIFGDGIGCDNICSCNKYIPLAEHDYYRGGVIYN